QGVAALGIIRVSGKDAISISNEIFKGKDLTKVDSHTVHYGFIVRNSKLDNSNQTQNSELETQNTIDEVMVSVFKAPKTFTAEDLVEISCHGSPYIQRSEEH